MADVPPARRRLLGAALRRYRESAGYGLNDAARILECDRSKISRIETGQRGIRPKELRELLAAYGVAQDERLALAAMARHNNRRGWWQSYEHVLSDAYQDYIIMESAAESIWAYESQLIPGLLQTVGYARALATASLDYVTSEQQEQFVRARLARQQTLLDDDPPRLWVIMSEGALYQAVGGPAVMSEQLSRLADACQQLPNVTVQVLPFDVGAHAAASGPFTILAFPEAPSLGIVYLEGQKGGIYLEDAIDVDRYNLVFQHLRASALSTAASWSLISEVANKNGRDASFSAQRSVWAEQ